MWVTFDVFTWNMMIKLKMAWKRSELECNKIRWLIRKLVHYVNTLWLAILLVAVCWGNSNVSSHSGTFHMTCTVSYFEITLKICIIVGRTINCNKVPPGDKNEWLSVSINVLGEVMVVIDPIYACMPRVWWL